MTSQAILRAFDPKTYDAIRSYRVKDDALMPLSYQNVPGGRPTHDDWALFKSTKRIDTAYRVPLPFRQISGATEKRWVLWDPSYPSSPGLQIEDRDVWDGVKHQMLPHALIDCAIEGSGWATFSAYINDEWTPVFKQYRKVIFGRLFACYSGGLKQDTTVTLDENLNPKSDIMGWWDPPSLSWNPVSGG